jgi:uncharacterized FlgJ-related protein
MKLYSYNKNTLQYNEVPYLLRTSKIILFISIFLFLFSGSTIPIEKVYVNNSEEILIIEKENEFNEQRLINKIKELNLPYPHITLAQAKLETGDYSSKIFRENHNLFGMKEARVRINLAKGTQYNHAYYNNWEESVLDYSFWYASYARKCKTEDELFQLLDAQYAEATYYVQSLKQIIKRENLKSKFN